MWASGTVSHMMRAHYPLATTCRTDNPPETKLRPLTLTDLAAAFFILGIGLSLSILGFAIKILFRCVSNRVQTVEKKFQTISIITLNSIDYKTAVLKRLTH